MTTATEILTPQTATVGEGATENCWSDRHAYTIIEVRRNGKQLVLQRDIAKRTNRDADTFAPGGFLGHTTSPKGQGWSYEQDPEGHTVTANWSEKRQRFCIGGAKGATVSPGRHEHYDYNF